MSCTTPSQDSDSQTEPAHLAPPSLRIRPLITTRASSTRLPQKYLAEIKPGQTLLDAVYARAALIGKPIIVTPDQEVADFCYERAYQCSRYAPPMRSVLHELEWAAHSNDLDAVVHTTGDCPFVCPSILMKTETALREGYGFVLFTQHGWNGFNCAGINTSRLQALKKRIMHHMEHGTTAFYTMTLPVIFKKLIREESIPAAFGTPRWFSVDTQDDLDWVREVAGFIGPKDTAQEIIRKCSERFIAGSLSRAEPSS